MSEPVHTGNPVDRRSVYFAVGAISGAGVLVSSAAPIIVGALASRFPFDQSQLGDIVALYNLTFTLLAFVALFCVRRVNWRVTSFVASLAGVAGFATLTQISDYAAVLATFALIGLSAGALYSLGMAITGDSDSPDRAFGLKLGIESVPSILLLYLVPAVAIPLGGFLAAGLALAATFLILGLFSFALPSHGVKGAGQADGMVLAEDTPTGASIVPSLLVLTASIIFFAGIAATWAFLELIAIDRAFSADAIGIIFAIGFCVAAAGGFLAAFVGDRFGRVVPVIATIIVLIAGLALIGRGEGVWAFGLGVLVFLGTVNFGLAYFFGMSARVDLTGRFVVLSATTLSLGGVIGPAVGGRLIEQYGIAGVLAFSAVCGVLSLAIYAFVNGKYRHLSARNSGSDPACQK